MCIKCLIDALTGKREEPVGQAGTLALKSMQEAVFEKDRLEKLISKEISDAVSEIKNKHEATYKLIEERRTAAWDLVKTQLGLDPDSECDIHIVTGQVRQVIKEVPK